MPNLRPFLRFRLLPSYPLLKDPIITLPNPSVELVVSLSGETKPDKACVSLLC